MTKAMTTALGIGFGCLIWSLVATLTNFPTWMGFVGCTAYYAAGAGKTGALKALFSNYTGIIWGMLVFTLYGAGFMQHPVISLVAGALSVGIIAWGMTYQGKFDLLSNVPNTFMGCFSLFACNGEWKMLMLGVLCGLVLGFVCDMCASFFQRSFGKPETA